MYNMSATDVIEIQRQIEEINDEINLLTSKINCLSLKRKKLEKTLSKNNEVTCNTCIYYDRLLNICFYEAYPWKHVWDETEACENWDFGKP